MNSEIFRDKVSEILAECANRGLEYRVNSRARNLIQQGELWRVGRGIAQINRKIADLRRLDADILADAIESAGPQPGAAVVTYAIPGYSWHNWGLAVDVFAVIGGAACWDRHKYGLLAEVARLHGVYTGAAFGDFGHLQAEPGTVGGKYGLHEIIAEMRQVYG